MIMFPEGVCANIMQNRASHTNPPVPPEIRQSVPKVLMPWLIRRQRPRPAGNSNWLFPCTHATPVLQRFFLLKCFRQFVSATNSLPLCCQATSAPPILLPGIGHLPCLQEIRSVKDKPFYCQSSELTGELEQDDAEDDAEDDAADADDVDDDGL